jgi:glyceraldehyde-3-phosphate dehydrogenase (NAD(P))
VTFHKRTPLITEKAKVEDLVRRGANLAVDDNRKSTFEELGHSPKYETIEAIERAAVVIDCTPVGNEMKEEFYKDAPGPIGFMAQGSEYGFGKMYARGINDDALVQNEDRFLQIVSCNTHNIAVKSLAMDLTHQPPGIEIPRHAPSERHLSRRGVHRQPRGGGP